MVNDSNASKVTSNIFWRLMEQFGAQGVSFVVSLILARLLAPEAYGVVALVSVFTAILQVFVNCGFAGALVQKKYADDLDFSSVFYFNVCCCVLLYLIAFFTAPLVADFYEMPDLVPMIRVQSLILVIAGVKNVQLAYVSRQMIFKRFFFATLAGTIGAAVIGIWMAFNGYGAWGLIVQNLFNAFVDTVVLWITVKWRPKKMFSFSRLKSLFSYGWKMLASNLLNTVYTELRQLIIGKMYVAEDLAFYNKGGVYPKLVINNLNESIDSVMLPTMSNVQDDVTRLRNMTRRSIKVSSFIVFPVMVGLAVCATPIVRILLTDKWLPCVPYLRIFCFSYAFYPIHTSNLNAIKAMGRSDLFLILEIIKKVVGLIAIFSTMWFGVFPMALSLIFTSIASQIINSWPNKKLLNYSYIDQLKDILPNLGLAAFMGVVVFCVTLFNLNDLLTLLIQVPLGAIIYIGLSYIFKLDSFEYVLSIIKDFLNKRKKVKTEV